MRVREGASSHISYMNKVEEDYSSFCEVQLRPHRENIKELLKGSHQSQYRAYEHFLGTRGIYNKYIRWCFVLRMCVCV